MRRLVNEATGLDDYLDQGLVGLRQSGGAVLLDVQGLLRFGLLTAFEFLNGFFDAGLSYTS